MAWSLPDMTTLPSAKAVPTPSPAQLRTIASQTDMTKQGNTAPLETAAKPDMLLRKPQEMVKPVDVKPQHEEPMVTPTFAETPITEAIEATEITVRLGKGNLTVTARAAEKLKSSKPARQGEVDRALRVTPSPSVTTQLRMFVDKQGPDDLIVVSHGVKILFLSPEATEMLEGVVIDYQETDRGGSYTLSKKKQI